LGAVEGDVRDAVRTIGLRHSWVGFRCGFRCGRGRGSEVAVGREQLDGSGVDPLLRAAFADPLGLVDFLVDDLLPVAAFGPDHVRQIGEAQLVLLADGLALAPGVHRQLPRRLPDDVAVFIVARQGAGLDPGADDVAPDGPAQLGDQQALAFLKPPLGLGQREPLGGAGQPFAVPDKLVGQAHADGGGADVLVQEGVQFVVGPGQAEGADGLAGLEAGDAAAGIDGLAGDGVAGVVGGRAEEAALGAAGVVGNDHPEGGGGLHALHLHAQHLVAVQHGDQRDGGARVAAELVGPVGLEQVDDAVRGDGLEDFVGGVVAEKVFERAAGGVGLHAVDDDFLVCALRGAAAVSLDDLQGGLAVAGLGQDQKDVAVAVDGQAGEGLQLVKIQHAADVRAGGELVEKRLGLPVPRVVAGAGLRADPGAHAVAGHLVDGGADDRVIDEQTAGQGQEAQAVVGVDVLPAVRGGGVHPRPLAGERPGGLGHQPEAQPLPDALLQIRHDRWR